jgi:ABC-type ATPase involved in cell division
MSLYSVAVTHAPDITNIIKLVRSVSSESVAGISQKIGTENSVIEFDTTAFSLEISHDEGVKKQHRKILSLIYELKNAGATLLIRHHAGSIVEVVSEEVMKNLFESELIYLAQEHD